MQSWSVLKMYTFSVKDFDSDPEGFCPNLTTISYCLQFFTCRLFCLSCRLASRHFTTWVQEHYSDRNSEEASRKLTPNGNNPPLINNSNLKISKIPIATHFLIQQRQLTRTPNDENYHPGIQCSLTLLAPISVEDKLEPLALA